MYYKFLPLNSIELIYRSNYICSRKQKCKFVGLYQPFTVIFFIYNNLVVVKIGIEGVFPNYKKNKTIHDLRKLGIKMLYCEFENKGKVKSYAYTNFKQWVRNVETLLEMFVTDMKL